MIVRFFTVGKMELVILVILAILSSSSISLLIGFAAGLLYALSYYDRTERTGTRRWLSLQRFLSVNLFGFIKRYYFGYEVIYRGVDKEEVMRYQRSNGTTAIFAASPHGLFAIGTFFLVATPDYRTKTGLHWKHVRPCIHRHVFAVPFLRDIALWLGAIDVSREPIEQMLDSTSVIIAPGGTREMIIDPDAPIQTRHTGFLRLAYSKQKPVFPVLHIGQDNVFRSYSCKPLDTIRQLVLAYTGYPFPTFFIGPLPAKLTTYIFAPHEPSVYDSEEAFVNAYYTNLMRYSREISQQ